MFDRQKTIVAAILAVHSGRVSADEAAALLEDPGKASSLRDFDASVPTVTLAAGERTIAEVLDSPEMQKQALREIGIGEAVQETLFNFDNTASTPQMRLIRDTLQAVASTGRDLASKPEFLPTPDDHESEDQTHVPTDATRRTLRLTTGRFFPRFGMEGERYELKKEHARGGMGRVMLAKDCAIGRDVAVKELLPGLASGASVPASVPAGTETGGIVERFLREARITGQLEHPNIVPVYEIGQRDDGSFYYTMRFIRGKTLADRLREIRKDAEIPKAQKLGARIELLDRFIDVCHAIAYAHSKGVINRDIKPENIMLGDFGETLVLDWGLARLKGQEDKALEQLQKGTLALSKSLIESDSTALTLDGSIVGTPAYMSPEQARGDLDAVDEQSDVYALGAVLHQILSGHPPYEGPMPALIVQAVLAGPPVPVRSREPNVPRELEALVERAMAREKSERLKSALELAAEVKAFRDGRTLGSYSYTTGEMISRFVRQHRTTVGIGVLGFLLVVAATVFFMQRLTDERDTARIAQHSAEEARNSATSSLELAQQERAERERMQREANDRAREEYRLRLREAERVLGTIEGMRIEPALQDLEGRLARYDAELKGPPSRQLLELEAPEQMGNSVLLSNLLGYIAARDNLHELLDGPVGEELPAAFRQFDLAAERKILDDLRSRTARLARINGDFNLAEFLVSGSNLGADAIKQQSAEIFAAREALLSLHAVRIDEALADVRGGIGRAGRDPGAPTVAEYVRRLSNYREPQTVDALGKELDRLIFTPADKWTRAHIHCAVLVCRVLGNVEQPARTVPMLAKLLDSVDAPEAVEAASLALGDTNSADAAAVLIDQIRKRGLDYWEGAKAPLAKLPLPARLRNPQAAQDLLDLAIVSRSKGDTVGAADAATRALNQDSGLTEALLLRGLAHSDAGRRDDALRDLDQAVQAKADDFEALIARALARNVYADGDAALADLEAAIKAQPENPRGYLHRARVLGQRARVEDAAREFMRAADLAPANLEYRLELGEFLHTMGRARFADAEAEFTRVIEQAPDDWRGWSARCVLRRDTSFGGCIKDGQEATRLNPADARAYNFMAQSYYGLGHITEGIEAATNAVKADPNEWLAHYYRAILYLRMQDAEDARARDNLGDRTTGDARQINLERVISDFRSVVAVNPQDFRSHALMADTLIELDRYDEARLASINALNLAPFDGESSTIGLRNWGVRQGMLEIEGAAWAGRAPDTIPAMVRLSHYHMRRALRPRAPLADYREAARWVRQARLLVAPQTPPTERYELASAETRLAGVLLGAEYYAEMLRVTETRVSAGDFTFADDHLNHARALAGLAEQHLESRVKLVEADEADLQKAAAEFNALTPVQRRERADELVGRCFASLHAAITVGFWDATGLEREKCFAHMRGTTRWIEWQAAVRASEAVAPSDPGQATRVAFLTSVIENGPAFNAGLRRLDVITEINGIAVSNTNETMAALRAFEPGARYAVTVRRYPVRDGRLTFQAGADGRRTLDERGIPAWRFSEQQIELKQGFLGIRLDDGALPSPLYP